MRDCHSVQPIWVWTLAAHAPVRWQPRRLLLPGDRGVYLRGQSRQQWAQEDRFALAGASRTPTNNCGTAAPGSRYERPEMKKKKIVTNIFFTQFVSVKT